MFQETCTMDKSPWVHLHFCRRQKCNGGMLPVYCDVCSAGTRYWHLLPQKSNSLTILGQQEAWMLFAGGPTKNEKLFLFSSSPELSDSGYSTLFLMWKVEETGPISRPLLLPINSLSWVRTQVRAFKTCFPWLLKLCHRKGKNIELSNLFTAAHDYEDLPTRY